MAGVPSILALPHVCPECGKITSLATSTIMAYRVAIGLCFGGVASSFSFTSAELLPQSNLVSNCFNFPEDTFGYDNSVKNTYGSSPHLMRDAGESAVDFTLHDTNGTPWNLGDALEAGEGKPVVLIFGMSTCPAYQGLDYGEDSTTSWAYWDEFKLVEDYGDKATFVHVYGPEPHPVAPDLNFDSGKLLPNYWSILRQPVTYDDRVQAAKNIRSITHEDQVILPDYLTGNPYSSLNQPVWCSYAMGARSSIIVASSGSIFYQQDWLDSADLGVAIDGYWEQDGGGTWTDKHVQSPKEAAGRKGTKGAEGKRQNRD